MPPLSTLPDTFTAYPAPESVFATDVDKASQVFLPLLTIDLCELDPTLTEKVHLVCPVEPHDGYLLGEGNDAYHSEYARLNWAGFRLTEDNRYEFLGDWRYFHALNPDSPYSNDAELHKFYAEAHESYHNHQQFYRQHGVLARPNFGDPTKLDVNLAHSSPLNFLDTWDEPPLCGNWEYAGDFPTERLEDGTYPVNADQRPFRFIGAVPGYCYGEFGPDALVLFFDPETRIVLLTFDWT